MAENNISLHDDELHELSALVAEALQRGESREQVVADLAKNGLGDEEAEEMVSAVEYELYQFETSVREVDDGTNGMGWAFWIAIGLGVKLLSWFFQ